MTTNNDSKAESKQEQEQEQDQAPVQQRTEPKKQASMYDNAQPTGAPHHGSSSSTTQTETASDKKKKQQPHDNVSTTPSPSQSQQARKVEKEAASASAPTPAVVESGSSSSSAPAQAQQEEVDSKTEQDAPPTDGFPSQVQSGDHDKKEEHADESLSAKPVQERTEPKKQASRYDNDQPTGAAGTSASSSTSGAPAPAPAGEARDVDDTEATKGEDDSSAPLKKTPTTTSSASPAKKEEDATTSSTLVELTSSQSQTQSHTTSTAQQEQQTADADANAAAPVQQRTEPKKQASKYDNSQPTGGAAAVSEGRSQEESPSSSTAADATADTSASQNEQQQSTAEQSKSAIAAAAASNPISSSKGDEEQKIDDSSADAATASETSQKTPDEQQESQAERPVQQRTEPKKLASTYDNSQPTGETSSSSSTSAGQKETRRSQSPAQIDQSEKKEQEQQQARTAATDTSRDHQQQGSAAAAASPSPSPSSSQQPQARSVSGGGSIRDLIKGFESKAAAAGGNAAPAPAPAAAAMYTTTSASPTGHGHGGPAHSDHVEKGPQPVQERTEPERSASKYDNSQPTGAKTSTSQGKKDANKQQGSSGAATPSTAEDEARIKELGDAIRQLKIDHKPFDAELKEMAALKAKVGQAGGGGGGGGKRSKASDKMALKTPKGTKDHLPSSTLLRKRIFDTLEGIFQKHGAMTIDTPVFELKEILAGKYGEDSKLIYDLKDQGGEICSLRYDLTVPFARFLAMNQHLYPQMKRYHIGKVYRRDQPALSKGRMREFYQCDYDVAGSFDPMVPDAEVLAVVVEALEALEIGDFTVKINHRKVLDGIFEIAGVPADKTRAISSAVDKLDKSPWAEVKKEMTEEKGLDAAVADRIGEYVKLKGPGKELLAKLQQDPALTGNPGAKQGLDDMALLFDYLEIFGALDRMSFDLSLARGLDYYTGIIYEAVHESSAAPQLAAAAQAPAPGVVTQQKKKKVTETEDVDEEIDESTVGVGSIAAGGRYDELVGMFVEASGGKKGSGRIPCVGVSVGVERVYSIMLAKQKERMQDREARGKETEVYVVSMGGNGLLKERMQLAKQLWDAGIKAEFMYKNKPKPNQQLDACDKDQTPFTVIIGPAEVEAQTARVRRQLGKEGGTTEGDPVPRSELVEHLKAKIAEWRETL